MKIFTRIAAVAVVLAGAFPAIFPTAGQAATINFYDNPTAFTGFRGVLTCSVACSALHSTTAIYSTDTGGVFTVHPPNETNQTTFVNQNRKAGDPIYTVASAQKSGDNPPSSFTTDALYTLLKIGNGNTFQTLLVRNETGFGGLHLSWQGESASGLSHYTRFGDALPPAALPIPLPAGGLLLISALGGLGLAARRRKSRLVSSSA